MAVKTLDQVLTELQGTYDPQIQSLQKQQSMIPDQIAQNEQQLGAKQEQAFGDILNGARRRGLGFSGIPLQEQAKYTATDYLPALANLHTAGIQQAQSLQDAINQVLERRNTLAQQLVSQSQQQDLAERQFAEQQRQFDAELALKRASAGSGFNPTINPSGGGQSTTANAVQRPDKGFNFTDHNGRPISAAAYSQLTGIPFRELLQNMANEGDVGAQKALGFVGNDYGYDPRNLNNNASLYNNLVWGVRPNATGQLSGGGGNGGWA